MAGFSAFIDESGCDGFEFGCGASEILVIGAVVCRTSNVKQFDEAAKKLAETCNKKKSRF